MTTRTALQLALVVALALPGRVAAQDPALTPPVQQCTAGVAVTCPARREMTLLAGWSPESFSVAIAWTAVRRFGAYVRLFPQLEPNPAAAPNTTTRAESLMEFGVAYRLTAPITIGVGYGKFTQTDSEYGSTDPFTFRIPLIDRQTSGSSGPALFIAYAFHRPERAIGLAASASLGVVGSGVAVGTTLRFPLVRAPIGIQ